MTIRSLTLAAASLAAAAIAVPAGAATTLDFNDLKPATSSSRTYVYGAYESDGYRLTSSSCPANSRGQAQCFVTPANTVNNIDRTGAALVNFAGNATVSLARIDGGLFQFDSLVLASNTNNASGLGRPTQDALFTFNLGDGTTSSQTRTIATTGSANRNLLTFAQGPVSSVSFRPSTGTGGFLQFDDVTVSPVGVGAVPEPSVWAFLILGFGATGGALRRRRRVGGAALA